MKSDYILTRLGKTQLASLTKSKCKNEIAQTLTVTLTSIKN